MMNDKDFIDAVWNKYNRYVEDDLANHTQKKRNINRGLRFACNFMLTLIILTGVAYAGVTFYKNNFIQKSTITDFEENKGYDYSQDTEYSNGLYYKKIYTYEDYIEAQKRWNNLVDMQQEDFNDSFVIILAGENYDTTNLYVSNIYDKDETMCIELKKKEEWNIEDTTISLKVLRELDREKLEIINLPNEVNTLGKYKDLDLVTIEYSTEQAIKDNCFVIKDNKVISKDKEQLDNFVENCNNGINDMIRIYTCEEKSITITDLEYKDNKINMVSECIDIDTNEEEKYYNTGCQIIVRKENDDNYKDYILYDELGNNTYISIIEY